MPSTSRPAPARSLASREPGRSLSVAILIGAVIMVGCAEDRPSASPNAEATATTSVEPDEPDRALPVDPSAGDHADVPDGLDLFVHQPRYLQGISRLAIAVTNGRDAPIVVHQLALRAEHFVPLPPESKASTISPGARTDLQIDVGDTVCGDRAPSTARVDVELTVDGATGWHTATVDTELLDRLHDAECSERAVADAVTIAFGDDPSVHDGRVHAEIVFARAATQPDHVQPIRVESVRGSVVFVMLADGVPSDDAPRPLRVIAPDEAGDTPMSIPVEISVSRCDPHVIGQAQRPHDFRVWVTLGDGDTVLVGLEPDPVLLERLDEIVATCEPGRPN